MFWTYVQSCFITAFSFHTDSFDVFFLPPQEKLEQSPKRDIEGMGVAEIKYGDSLCFITHVATGLWLSYQAPDVKSARLGPLKRRVSEKPPRVFCLKHKTKTPVLW